jgi:hypothetical protein
MYRQHPTYHAALQAWWKGVATEPTIRKHLLKDLHAFMVALSFSLTARATAFAHNERWDTPYSKLAEQNGFNHTGGKMDDITVMALYVHGATSSSDMQVSAAYPCDTENVSSVHKTSSPNGKNTAFPDTYKYGLGVQIADGCKREYRDTAKKAKYYHDSV